MQIGTIINHVPLWAWILLAYLVRQGVAALSTQTIPIRRAILIPLVFMGWGLSGLFMREGLATVPLMSWLIVACIFAPLGYRVGLQTIVIDLVRMEVWRAPSIVPLVRNVGLFTLQFTIAVASAHRPDLRHGLGLLRCVISGAMAGYFAGWALAFNAAYARQQAGAA